MSCLYRELWLRGERFCAYPAAGVPADLWKVYPVRGLRLGRVMRMLCRWGLDRLITRTGDFPLRENGISEGSLRAFVEDVCQAPQFAFAWPSPRRSVGRAYAYVVDGETKKLVGYLKFATKGRECVCLQKEVNALRHLDALKKDLPFNYPHVLATKQFGEETYGVLFEALPTEAPRWVRWNERSWNDDILPLKRSFSEGTERHLTAREAQELPWVKAFFVKATAGAANRLQKVLEKGLNVCATHGDMACQNFRCHNGRYWLFDWEEFTEDGPVAADELSFKLSTGVYDRGLSFEDAMPQLPREQLIAAAAFQFANDLSFARELGELLETGVGIS